MAEKKKRVLEKKAEEKGDNGVEITKKETEEELRKKKEKQAIEHNKILRNILIVIGIALVAAIVFIIASNSMNNFTYKGVNFKKTETCGLTGQCLILYQTSTPVQYQGKIVPYNFYLRNDPRKLNVPFNGTIELRSNMTLNFDDNLICNGQGGIAAANLGTLYYILSENYTSNKNVTCDPLGRFMYVNVISGNVTKIDQIGPACYRITINNCEVLPGTEEFMVQTFIKVNELLKNQSKS